MIENTKYTNKYNFAFIDEATKKEIRRKLLKAVAIPGHQVPYSSPEMPISRGWGTGGLHITLAVIGKEDVFKIIDQGSDASVNACNLREFVNGMTGCKTTFDTAEATLIQTRHRITEEELTYKQIIVFQVPLPEPLRMVERYEYKTLQMHAEADYAKMYVSLYESYVRHGAIMQGAGYPVMVNGRYIMSPSPIPRWDTPNLNQAQTLFLFGAGREKRLYAVPPFTDVEPLEFEDVNFEIEDFSKSECYKTGYKKAFLDEIYSDEGERKFVISDSNFLDKKSEKQETHQYSNKYIDQLQEYGL
ncbi:alpha-D-ribose 1-methylphosphonate 5-phosphate C-P-lyase PhnJ [Mucilaginibacter rubeus]|uniref:Alpha-D-ribose 1-methylphosphonate 5-phosphate C-P-lyase PhnJ n=1 Tax=Mucilaginibacter rubeus TaxID=2027860 RepID=A0A5C1HTN4_9SPHI|nr:alpha-D-ribose 1-methylphosphonate 5-phosphate C-P-lyase PhnJ [Mucilaginibacter rubeus]QEM08975.1 alpha-D-ribose 1-methylphosphonate 5-phosphate C-P-lyase PhnJ [Mucilaginibacter rubeus]